MSAIVLKEHLGSTSMALTRFITDRGGEHCLYRVGYRNVIDKGVQLNEDGIDAHLMMETSGHGALKEKYFLDDDLVPGLEVKDGKTVNNPLEAYIITEITDKLTCQGIRGEDIGVITPYNSQVNLIQQFLSKSVEIHTIDKYQIEAIVRATK